MIKLLLIFSIFTITALPALAGKRADCEQAITSSQFKDWPDRYQTMAQNVLNNSLAEPMKAQYTTGVGCTAKCTARQKLQDCVTPTQHKDACAQIFANNLIKEQYESEFKLDLCGYISENEESNFSDMMTDNEISYWVEYKKNNYTATSTSSDAAPRVESQSDTSSTKKMTVSGTVLDENNQPLPGAAIYIPGSTTGTATDIDGKFELKKCTGTQIKEHPNAKKTGIQKGTNNCIATECKCGYKLDADKCVKWMENEPCSADTKPALPGNAKSAIMKCDGEKAYCEISECNDGYKVSEDKKSCVSTRGDDCDATAVDPNATAGTNKKVRGKITCIITDCAHGFAPNKDGTKCVAGELSESDSQAKIDELRDNAQKMKDKEQSTANKLLGAAGIGATGIGGMQLASAMAEQNADADAERAMRAYLATFHCNYNGGKNIAGGERDVELPGGNELINLYSEYVNLANDLKTRKTALDMRPGIESESILDAATSGLYDDVAIGKTSGAYTSLARALMDPTGADAAAWAAQKEETANKKKTGMITAGIGAAGSLVGNLALNSGKDKQNKVDEILNKYEKLKKPFQEAQQDFDEIPAKKCSEFSGTTGTGNAPDCVCTDTTNTRFFPDQGGCIACESGKVYDENNQCKCPADKPRNENGECKAQISSCQLTGAVKNGKCECVDNATNESNICKCNPNFNEIDGQCTPSTEAKDTPIIPVITPIQLSIKSDTAFNSGYSTLTSKGQSALATLTQQLQQNSEVLEDGNYCIKITGHTDRVPFKKSAKKTNKQLSEERANAIKNELLNHSFIKDVNIRTIGMGETACTTDKYQRANDERCRRVNIELTSGKCQTQ